MKIAICTPYYSGVTAEYARSLASMITFTSHARINFNGVVTLPQFEVFIKKGTVLPQLRNYLVKDAVDWGANYLLWIDADHSFPADALVRLLSRNVPVIGVNYPRRSYPTSPTAFDHDMKLVWTTEELARQGAVVQVRGLGLGFCLVDMNVIHALMSHRSDGEEKPFFALEMLGNGLKYLGEDVFFFNRISEAGIPVYLDHGLSWQIGHLHERMLTNADAEAQREAFEGGLSAR